MDYSTVPDTSKEIPYSSLTDLTSLPAANATQANTANTKNPIIATIPFPKNHRVGIRDITVFGLVVGTVAHFLIITGLFLYLDGVAFAGFSLIASLLTVSANITLGVMFVTAIALSAIALGAGVGYLLGVGLHHTIGRIPTFNKIPLRERYTQLRHFLTHDHPKASRVGATIGALLAISLTLIGTFTAPIIVAAIALPITGPILVGLALTALFSACGALSGAKIADVVEQRNNPTLKPVENVASSPISNDEPAERGRLNQCKDYVTQSYNTIKAKLTSSCCNNASANNYSPNSDSDSDDDFEDNNIVWQHSQTDSDSDDDSDDNDSAWQRGQGYLKFFFDRIKTKCTSCLSERSDTQNQRSSLQNFYVQDSDSDDHYISSTVE